MDSYINPYAAPASRPAPSPIQVGSERIWRDRSDVVMPVGGSLPSRCVKCNADVPHPTKVRTLYWHPSWVYLTLLVNVMVYIVVAMIVRKKALAAPALCRSHQVRRRWFITLAWFGLFAAITSMVLGIAKDEFEWAMAGLFAGLIMIIAGAILGRIVYAAKIDKDFVRLRGFGEAFLASLPAAHPGYSLS